MAKMKNDLAGAAQALVSVSAQDSHQSISMKDNRVEFRSAGGDYLNMFDDIIASINRAVYALSVAANPEAHKKEYAKKLYKLASSVNDTDERANKIFAMYNAGVIDKERLKAVLKSKQEQKDQTVDTGEPQRAEPLDKDEKMIKKIADHYSISDGDAGILWMEGEQKEYEKWNDLDKAHEEVYKNLMHDIGYYRR